MEMSTNEEATVDLVEAATTSCHIEQAQCARLGSATSRFGREILWPLRTEPSEREHGSRDRAVGKRKNASHLV